MASKQQSATEAVQALIRLRQSPKRWYGRIAPEHQAQLDELRKSWKAGRLGTKKATAARSIAAYLKEMGIAAVGRQGVETWLDEE